MVVTDEICGVLLRGDIKPLKNADEVVEETLSKEANAEEYIDIMASYNKKGNLLIKTDEVLLNCTLEDAIAHTKEVADKLKKKIVFLENDPTKLPYIAFFNKGISVNPTVGIVEIVPWGVSCKLEMAAITNKSGVKKGHSCSATLDKFLNTWEELFGEVEV